MIEAGTSKTAPFDVVVVHSFRRFFRDHLELEFYVRKLAKNGVELVSITQEMGDDPKELKPVSEIVTVPVPPIIGKETFDAVHKLLKARNPKVMPARVIREPTMLTNLIHCTKCSGAMTIRTGKGGPYRY